MGGTSELTEVSFTGDELRNLALPAVAINFGRVTVAVGSRGSGKSGLLLAIADHHAQELAPDARRSFGSKVRTSPYISRLS
jgi:predicted ATPase